MTRFKIFKGVKNLINTIKISVFHIVTILSFLAILILIFAILGLNLWKGKLNYRCRLTPAPLNGTWPVNTSELYICGSGFKCYKNETCGSNYNF